MSYRRNTTTRSQSSIAATQRSYVVRIDAGAFANVEIVVVGGGVSSGYHREGGWAPPRSPTVTATRKGHGYTHVPIPSTPSTKRSPFSPLQTPPAPPDVRSKRTYEREHIAEQRRMAEEKRAREDIKRKRREKARLAEARRAAAAAAAEEEARQRRRRQEQQRQKEEEHALREERRRRRLERARLARDREIASAWRTYEARWGLLSQSQRQPERGLGLLGALTFERIPWPVAKEENTARPDEAVQALDALRPEAIREFLLSSAHSPDVSPKDRIRAALRRWHPDKFARVLSLVIESDRDAVAEGMGIVVRCLNDMLERKNHA